MNILATNRHSWLALPAMVLLTGCGGGGSDAYGPETSDPPEVVARHYVEATTCAQMKDLSTKSFVDDTSCDDSSGPAAATDVVVGEPRIDGDSATVEVSYNDGIGYTVLLVKTDKGWRVDGTE